MADHILVIDGETIIRDTVARILTREGFHVHLAENADQAMALAHASEALTVVITDGRLEGLRLVKEAHPTARAIVLSDSTEASPEAMRLGVDQYMRRPFDMEALLDGVRSLVASHRRERDRHALLERLRKNVVTMVGSLAQALEARDPYTAGHSQRVAEFSMMIGTELGLSDLELEVLRHGAALHDIGKIAVKQDVLNKPGRLTDEEFEHIKIHPVVGKEILEPIEDFKEMLDLVYYHHERIDGRGYPEGLKGDNIPLLAQIVAVADTYDAMTSDRPYRQGMHPERALAIMKEVSGTQLNGDLVAILSRRIRSEASHGVA